MGSSESQARSTLNRMGSGRLSMREGNARLSRLGYQRQTRASLQRLGYR